MSTIIKVAEDTDDFGETPREPERRNTRNSQGRDEQSLLRSRSLPSDRSFHLSRPQKREQVFVERGDLYIRFIHIPYNY